MSREKISPDFEKLVAEGDEKLRQGKLDTEGNYLEKRKELMTQAKRLAEIREELLGRLMEASKEEAEEIKDDYLKAMQEAEAVNVQDNTVPVDLEAWQHGFEEIEKKVEEVAA